MRRILTVALGMVLAASTVSAQPAGGVAPHAATLKAQAETVRSFVLRTAEKVPEDYGNLVTYMRLKNIVPPSSER